MKIPNTLDVASEDIVEILLKRDGKTIWVNTKSGCILRISNIKHLIVTDARAKKETWDDIESPMEEKNGE